MGKSFARFWLESSNDLRNRLCPLNTDQFFVQPAVEIRQPVRVNTQLLKHGSVQVLNVEAVADGRGAQLVRFTDAHASLDAAAGQPHGEAVGVVIAAGAHGVLSGRLS